MKPFRSIPFLMLFINLFGACLSAYRAARPLTTFTQNDVTVTLFLEQNPDGDYYILLCSGQRNCEILEAAIQRECIEEAGVKIAVVDGCYVHDYIETNEKFAVCYPGFHQTNLLTSNFLKIYLAMSTKLC